MLNDAVKKISYAVNKTDAFTQVANPVGPVPVPVPIILLATETFRPWIRILDSTDFWEIRFIEQKTFCLPKLFRPLFGYQQQSFHNFFIKKLVDVPNFILVF